MCRAGPPRTSCRAAGKPFYLVPVSRGSEERGNLNCSIPVRINQEVKPMLYLSKSPLCALTIPTLTRLIPPTF